MQEDQKEIRDFLNQNHEADVNPRSKNRELLQGGGGSMKSEPDTESVESLLQSINHTTVHDRISMDRNIFYKQLRIQMERGNAGSPPVLHRGFTATITPGGVKFLFPGDRRAFVLSFSDFYDLIRWGQEHENLLAEIAFLPVLCPLCGTYQCTMSPKHTQNLYFYQCANGHTFPVNYKRQIQGFKMHRFAQTPPKNVKMRQPARTTRSKRRKKHAK